jgi:lipopolysaccharide export LptBFGC system permease protein LptF
MVLYKLYICGIYVVLIIIVSFRTLQDLIEALTIRPSLICWFPNLTRIYLQESVIISHLLFA